MSGQISVADTAELLTDLRALVNGQEPKLTSTHHIGETPRSLYALAGAIGHLDKSFDNLIEATVEFLMQTFSDFYNADQYLKNQISQIGAGLNGTTSGLYNQPQGSRYWGNNNATSTQPQTTSGANQKVTGLNGIAYGEYNQPETIWYGTDADPTYSAPTQSHVENIDGQEVVISNWQDV